MAAATGKACALGSLLASSSSTCSSSSSCIAGGGGCGGGSGYASGRNGIAGSVVGGVRGLSLSKSSGASWRQGQGRRCAGVAPAGIRASAAVVADAPPVPRLKRIYTEKVVPALKEEFNYTNPQEIPYLKKIVVNCGVGEAAQNAKSLESSVRDLSLVTGQKPVTTRAKKAIAGFKLREGVPVGVCLTLRGGVMYSFLDRLVNLALPRTRDFQGVNLYSFDGKGNYTLGLPEQSVFPEIRFENIDKERGMDVNIVTSAKNDNEGQKLLALLGMPFKDSATGGIATLTKKRKGGGAFKGGKPRKAVKPPKPQKKKK